MFVVKARRSRKLRNGRVRRLDEVYTVNVGGVLCVRYFDSEAAARALIKEIRWTKDPHANASWRMETIYRAMDITKQKNLTWLQNQIKERKLCG